MKQRTRALNQSGLVSLMVTMVLMMVISLIVLGFAQMSRREQRQVLDRQLSAQAFLAAETAVNDARTAITAALQVSPTVPDKTQCARTTGSDPYAGFDPVIDAANDVAYSCLLVTTRLPDISQSVSVNGTTSAVPIQPVGGPISRLHLEWALDDDPTAAELNSCAASIPVGGTDYFPKASNWQCPYGVVRFEMVPTDDLDRTALMNNNRVAFLYPTKTNGTPTMTQASMNGLVKNMGCTITGCSLDITNIAAVTSQYVIHVAGIYKGGTLTISADDAAGNPLLLQGAQALVDATGRAGGVLRRIQTRIALTGGGDVPFAALESGSSICKRFGVASDQFRIPSDIIGQDQNNPLCKALAVAAAAPPVFPAPPTPPPAPVPRPPAPAPTPTPPPPTPTPPPTPPPSSAGCVPTNTPKPPIQTCKYYYGRTIISNINAPGTIVGCRYDLSDGTAIVNQFCSPGNTFNHNFPTLVPELPWPGSCNAQNGFATLTSTLASGLTMRSTTNFRYPACFDANGNQM